MSELTLYFDNPSEAADLLSPHGPRLKDVAEALQVQITARDEWVKIAGGEAAAQTAVAFFEFLRRLRARGELIQPHTVDYTLEAFRSGKEKELDAMISVSLEVSPSRRPIAPKTLNQARFIQAFHSHDITFGIGPAGTGKTYLAMAAAVSALLRGDVSRIILTRPAIEAGEALGFLPGDLQQKILPYLRPLYDALYDMMGPEEIDKNIERGIIEVAPLAYMRGRTLNHAFVILDEAQNTSAQQMFMFLTRLGKETRAVVTGDPTQNDLAHTTSSGLEAAQKCLAKIQGISFHHFHEGDVVRHALVRRIIEAWQEPTG